MVKIMRNYVNELHNAGLTFTDIAKQTGISSKKLSQLSRGIKPLKSTSNDYQILRNASRRNAYKLIRESGVTAKDANKLRRIGLSEKTYHHLSIRNVSHTKINKTMYQLKMFAWFINRKTKEIKAPPPNGYCFSAAHSKINIKDFERFLNDGIDTIIDEMAEADVSEYDSNQELLNEAIRDGQSKLGGSNWELKSIVDIEVITYKIG